MHPTREKLKRQLLRQQTDLHEILSWMWPQYGSKYGNVIHDAEKWAEVANVYFVPELCIIISNSFNLGSADSAREEFLRLKMYEYGPERVIQALRRVAALVEHPNAFIPAFIDFNGKTYKILEGE